MGDNTQLSERLARYAQLRDDGLTRAEAIRELGLGESTSHRYERWYRSQRNLPQPIGRFTHQWYLRSTGRYIEKDIG